MLTLYTPTHSPRLAYAAQLLFEQLLGWPVTCTTDFDVWRNAPSPRGYYHTAPPPPDAPTHLHLGAHGILHETDIRRKALAWHLHEGLPVCFGVHADLPYDPLAMTFYFATRYEEYLDAPRDAHDRYPAAASDLYQYLHRPLLHEVAQQVGRAFQECFPTLTYQLPPFQYQATYDIDYAWAYLHKGAPRAAGGMLRDATAGHWRPALQRLGVWLGRTADPYHTFSLLDRLHAAHDITPLYFWLVGRYGPHDKNTSLRKPAFQALIRSLAANVGTGWHPSYASYDAPLATLAAEKSALESVIERPITQSRQHYLRLKLPDTYRRLAAIGVTDEYSMGYAEAIGFRAGLAIPFHWYDLAADAPTTLRVHPFAVMDVTLKDYLQLSPEAARQRIDALMQSLKRHGGTFTSLWHNNSLSEQDGWEGWRDVYAHLLQQAHAAAR